MVNPSFSTFSAFISSNFWPYMKNRDETSHTGTPLTQCMVKGTGNLELITPNKDRVAGGIQSRITRFKGRCSANRASSPTKKQWMSIPLTISVDIKTDLCLCKLKVNSCKDWIDTSVTCVNRHGINFAMLLAYSVRGRLFFESSKTKFSRFKIFFPGVTKHGNLFTWRYLNLWSAFGLNELLDSEVILKWFL